MTGKHLIYGLAYECPFVEKNDNCPLAEIDFLSFKEKVDWINSLNDLTRRSIWELHLICSKMRENRYNPLIEDDYLMNK
jgi:hypothetical protein